MIKFHNRSCDLILLHRHFCETVFERPTVLTVPLPLQGKSMFLTGDPGRRSKTRLPRAGIRSPFRGKTLIVQVRDFACALSFPEGPLG